MSSGSPARSRRPPWQSALLVCAAAALPLPYLLSDLVFLNYGDLYKYINAALVLHTGQEGLFVAHDRTTLYSWLILQLFELRGWSLLSFKLPYVLLLSLLSVQTWLLARLFTGNDSGIVSSLFVVSAFLFGHFAYFPQIDLLLLVCLNLCLLALYQAVRATRARWCWVLLSGLALGGTYALKQTVILLVGVLPLYLLLAERRSIWRVARLWLVQLAGLAVFLAPIEVLAYPNSFGYVGVYAKTLAEPEGALVEGSLPPDLARIPTYYFDPVMWQWADQLPYPRGLVRLDQVVALLAFILLLRSGDLRREARWLLLLCLLVFLPWFLHVAFKGHKVRQLIFPELLLFLAVGPALWYLVRTWLRPRLSPRLWLPAVAGLGLLTVLLGGLRMRSVHTAVVEGVRVTTLRRPDPMPAYRNYLHQLRQQRAGQ